MGSETAARAPAERREPGDRDRRTAAVSAPATVFGLPSVDAARLGDAAGGRPGRAAAPVAAPGETPLSGAAARTIRAASASGGRPLAPPDRARLEGAFGRDLAAVRLHDGGEASGVAAQLGARAFAAGDDVFLGRAAPRSGPAWTALLAHEVAHVVQAGSEPAPGAWRLGAPGDAAERAAGAAATRVVSGAPAGRLAPAAPGVVRRDPDTPAAPADPAVIEAFLRAPPPARMSASLQGLHFTPVDTALFDFPDGELTKNAVVLARLTDRAYDPAWPRLMAADPASRVSWQHEAGRFSGLVVTPGMADAVLAFAAARAGGPDHIAITEEQRGLVLAGQALNPVPREIRDELASFLTVHADTEPRVANILTAQSTLNRLAAMWWGRTQAYVRAYVAWRADPSPDKLTLAAAALDELFQEFDPYSQLLGAIHGDAALQPLPEWRRLWPRPNTGVPAFEAVDAMEASRFTRYAASQPRDFQRLARRDAAARRSLLLGFAHSGDRDRAAEGDQQVSTAPSPYNAPALPIRLQAHPAVEPPLFAAATEARITFFTSVMFENLYEALGHAFGGWRYAWDVFRVPQDDLARIADTSLAPVDTGGWDTLQSALAQDLRYAAEDRARVSDISRLASVFGPPGFNVDTLMGATTLLDFAGTLISHGIRELTRPQSEFDVTFDGAQPGLYLIRCRVGPRLADSSTQALFRRAPSVAWLPVHARAPAEMARARLREEALARIDAAGRYADLRTQLAEPVTHDDQAALEEEFRLLGLSLYGSAPDILAEQRRAMVSERTRLEAAERGRDRPSAELRALRERIEQLDLVIALRAGRARRLAGAVHRLPATLVKDDGQTISLMIEASLADARGPRWYVSDVTTPSSGHMEGTAGNRLVPGSPNADAVLVALKALLESPSGYGRGQLAVEFPRGFDNAAEPHGWIRSLRIATDEAGIAMHAIENITTLVSIAAVVAAPFTGGASLSLLLPIGIVGALPSAYRLAHRGQMGTLRFDLQTAMEVVDIVTAALSLGEIGAGLRAAARAGTRAGLRWAVVEGSLWIAGIGGNGLGMLMMGAGLIEALQAVQGLPPGLRAARVAEILGNAMLQIGIQAGAHLSSRAHFRTTEASVRTAAEGADLPARPAALPPPTPAAPAAAPGRRPRGRRAPSEAQRRGLAGDVADAPLDVDRRLRGNTVQVEYRIDPGTRRVDPRSIRVVAARGATTADIAFHAEAVRTLRSYAGLLGAVHEGMERLRVLLGSHRRPAQGSPAWEAQLEFAKLRDIIAARMAEVRADPTNTARLAELAPEFANLADQLAYSQSILAGHDPVAPQGFIAARSVAERIAVNRDAVVAANVRVVVEVNGQLVARSAADATAGGVDPAPGHALYLRDGQLAVRRLPAVIAGGADPELMAVRVGGETFLVPAAAVGRSVDLGGGRSLTIDAARLDFAGRRAQAAYDPPVARSAGLEAELTRIGLPDTPATRALLRRWGSTIEKIGGYQTGGGANLRTAAEIAHAGAEALRGRAATTATYSEGRYDDFRYAIREAALAAILAAPPDQQLARYHEIYRILPDNASGGELWSAFRVARGQRAGAAGFASFTHLALTTQLIAHTPRTLVDGAITMTAAIGAGGPPPGHAYALESKAGGSYDPEQAMRYSDHLTANSGRVVLADRRGGPYEGIVYLFDNLDQATRAVRNLDANLRHHAIYVTYLDANGVQQPVRRSVVAPPAAPVIPAAPAAPVSPAPP